MANTITYSSSEILERIHSSFQGFVDFRALARSGVFHQLTQPVLLLQMTKPFNIIHDPIFKYFSLILQRLSI